MFSFPSFKLNKVVSLQTTKNDCSELYTCYTTQSHAVCNYCLVEELQPTAREVFSSRVH